MSADDALQSREKRIKRLQLQFARGPRTCIAQSLVITAILSAKYFWYPPLFLAEFLIIVGVLYSYWRDLPKHIDRLQKSLVTEAAPTPFSPIVRWNSPIIIFLLAGALCYGIGSQFLPKSVWAEFIHKTESNEQVKFQIDDGKVQRSYLFAGTYIGHLSDAFLWHPSEAHFLNVPVLEVLYPTFKPWHGDLTPEELAKRHVLEQEAREDRTTTENEDIEMVRIRFLTMPDITRDRFRNMMIQQQFYPTTPVISQEYGREVWRTTIAAPLASIAASVPADLARAGTSLDAIYLVPLGMQGAIEPFVCTGRQCAYYLHIDGNLYAMIQFDVSKLANWQAIVDGTKRLLDKASVN